MPSASEKAAAPPGGANELANAPTPLSRSPNSTHGATKSTARGIELGRTGGSDPVPIGELARRRDIPVQFLEQLFAVLRRGGILKSQRGVKGGYSFAKDPAQVTILEVVELLDGPLGRDADGVFADAATAARQVLEATTIADVVERERREAGAAMYYI